MPFNSCAFLMNTMYYNAPLVTYSVQCISFVLKVQSQKNIKARIKNRRDSENNTENNNMAPSCKLHCHMISGRTALRQQMREATFFQTRQPYYTHDGWHLNPLGRFLTSVPCSLEGLVEQQQQPDVVAALANGVLDAG